MQYSIRTEQAYVDWCQRFLAFCGDTPAERLGVEDVQRFLSHLAVERSVAAKAQGRTPGHDGRLDLGRVSEQ